MAIGLVLALGIDIARTGGIETWLARRGVSPPYDPRGRTVEVDGRSVYLDCRGSGSPTVILEAGYLSGAGSWGSVLDGIAATTRVCAWDRPGIGRSEARGLHTGTQTTADLRAALAGAGEGGPYVVVAHSLGGVYAQLFAAVPAADGTRVVALVMIDTYEPLLGVDVDEAIAADVRADVRRALDDTGAMIQGGEDLDWTTTMAELEPLGPVRLPALLLSVEPRLRYGDPAEPIPAALIVAWSRAIAARYPIGRLEIVPNTGHFIHLERPSLVIDRVREVVLDARAG